jgi:adenine-specific DNA-methyltransferase
MELVTPKSRGAFFTPPKLAEFIVDWAVRSRDDRIMEPSCGEASFLLAASARLQTLAPSLFEDSRGALTGVEIHEESARRCRRILNEAGALARVVTGDFFEFDERGYDAIVGNPPYVRYQAFFGEARARALASALSQGVALNQLASSWAPFVIHAAKLLRPTGRMGLVLPAELLTVNYAEPVRRFLLKRFKSVRLVTFESRVFPGVLEDVVVLLAEGSGGTDHFEVYPATSLDSLRSFDQRSWRDYYPEAGKKWTPALVEGLNDSEFRSAVRSAEFEHLLDWGTTYLGAVSGNNDFFALSLSEASALGLREVDMLPLSPPGSRHLRGQEFSRRAWEEAASTGSKCYLFYPHSDRLSKSAAEYVASGERRGVHKAYKCQARDPWWRVPMVDTADLFLTYMDADRPRLVSNTARVAHLNSLYGVGIKKGRKQLATLLPITSVNSLTLAGAELVGRAYGGGMLKLEPREADRLPVPSLSLLKARESAIRAIAPQIGELISQRKLDAAIAAMDEVLFKTSKLSTSTLEVIRGTRAGMLSRRRKRATDR